MVILVHTWLVEADTTISGHFLWAEMEIMLFIQFYPPKYAHGRSLRHILDKITKWHFLRTSNEVIWPKKFLNSMHGLKSAILAILPEIGQLAAQRCILPVSFPVYLLLSTIVVNPPERKLTKRTSVQWSNLHELQIFNVWVPLQVYSSLER